MLYTYCQRQIHALNKLSAIILMDYRTQLCDIVWFLSLFSPEESRGLNQVAAQNSILNLFMSISSFFCVCSELHTSMVDFDNDMWRRIYITTNSKCRFARCIVISSECDELLLCHRLCDTLTQTHSLSAIWARTSIVFASDHTELLFHANHAIRRREMRKQPTVDMTLSNECVCERERHR